MSSQYGKLISYILLERFGEIVEKVGSYLFHYGSSPLLYIKKYTELPLSQVKESLCILIKHGLITFEPNKNENIANYSLKSENVYLMLRYPKYIMLVKKKFDEEGEVILEEILLSGFISASEIILKSFKRLKETRNNLTGTQIRDVLISLATAQYLMKIKIPDENKPVPLIEISEKDKFSFPLIDANQLKKLLENNIPLKGETYWVVNFDRFHQDLRDKLIVSAISKKIDEPTGELMKILLEQMYIRTTAWADVSNPIPIQEVKDITKKRNVNPLLVSCFEQFVNILEQDCCKVIKKFGDAGGGSYQIYLKEIITHLTWETIEQIVLEKFDSKAARIFRLIKLKCYIEPEQLQQLAMIPAKEAKRLSYQLLEENFIKVQELKKSSSSGPNKSFILFNIQISQVVRIVLELCFKALYNVVTRRLNEKTANKRIIDKKQKVDTIMLGMKEQGASEEQIADIEEMITPPEKELLVKIGKTMKKLNLVELELDDTVFLLNMFLSYDKS